MTPGPLPELRCSRKSPQLRFPTTAPQFWLFLLHGVGVTHPRVCSGLQLLHLACNILKSDDPSLAIPGGHLPPQLCSYCPLAGGFGKNTFRAVGASLPTRGSSKQWLWKSSALHRAEIPHGNPHPSPLRSSVLQKSASMRSSGGMLSQYSLHPSCSSSWNLQGCKTSVARDSLQTV